MDNFYTNLGFVVTTFEPEIPEIKGSKDLDFSLVSSINLSDMLHPCSWIPGPDKLGQKGVNPPHLSRYPQKTRNPKLKNFFQYKLEGLLSLKGLNSSLV